jgi:hypothetical protein
MGQFFTGRSGALYLESTGTTTPTGASTQALKLRDWSLETTLELLETTTVDTAVKSYTPGSVSSTGSATVLYYRKDTGEAGTQFTSFLDKIMKTASTGVGTSDRVGIILRAGSTAGTGSDIKDDISFNAYITNASMQVSTGELTSVAIQFTVDGPFLEVADA